MTASNTVTLIVAGMGATTTLVAAVCTGFFVLRSARRREWGQLGKTLFDERLRLALEIVRAGIAFEEELHHVEKLSLGKVKNRQLVEACDNFDLLLKEVRLLMPEYVVRHFLQFSDAIYGVTRQELPSGPRDGEKGIRVIVEFGKLIDALRRSLNLDSFSRSLMDLFGKPGRKGNERLKN